MLESFLDEARNEGKIRVLSTPETHSISNITLGPVITRDGKVGVQIQDRSSGRYMMIEISKPEETIAFLQSLGTAFEVATEYHVKLHTLLKDRSDARSTRG
jgi:hypothetical protein